MKIILIGIQGSGKSTQGNLLSQKLNLPYLSTGRIFRELAKRDDEEGRFIKNTIDNGNLIDDDRTLQIVSDYLKNPLYINGYILDGFPRTVNQANNFPEQIDFVIYLKVSDKEALWRLSGREDERLDTTLKAIRKRIDLFHQLTEPVLDVYRGKGALLEIDGEKSIEAIHSEIISKIQPS